MLLDAPVSFLLQVNDFTLAIQLWPPEPMDGVPEPYSSKAHGLPPPAAVPGQISTAAAAAAADGPRGATSSHQHPGATVGILGRQGTQHQHHALSAEQLSSQVLRLGESSSRRRWQPVGVVAAEETFRRTSCAAVQKRPRRVAAVAAGEAIAATAAAEAEIRLPATWGKKHRRGGYGEESDGGEGDEEWEGGHGGWKAGKEGTGEDEREKVVGTHARAGMRRLQGDSALSGAVSGLRRDTAGPMVEAAVSAGAAGKAASKEAWPLGEPLARRQRRTTSMGHACQMLADEEAEAWVVAGEAKVRKGPHRKVLISSSSSAEETDGTARGDATSSPGGLARQPAACCQQRRRLRSCMPEVVVTSGVDGVREGAAKDSHLRVQWQPQVSLQALKGTELKAQAAAATKNSGCSHSCH